MPEKSLLIRGLISAALSRASIGLKNKAILHRLLKLLDKQHCNKNAFRLPPVIFLERLPFCIVTTAMAATDSDGCAGSDGDVHVQ
jgi:hypothetical protein